METDLKETVWQDVDWIQLAQDRDQRRVFVKMLRNFPFS
jgi:hypothetical protein